MPPKKKKEFVRFRPWLQDERRRQKSFCKVWASKLAESDKGSYYTIETTAKLNFTSFLASGASFLGREASKRAKNSRQVPCHIKSDEGLFWKSLVTGEQFQEKLQEAVCCRFFQGSVELLENVSSKSWLAQNENYPSQITKDAFSTKSRALGQMEKLDWTLDSGLDWTGLDWGVIFF